MERYNLSTLCSSERKKRKLLGRGIGSTKGKTAGKGHKGAKARSGVASKPFFEGGQTPIYIRLPKRGFVNVNSKKSQLFVLTIGNLSKILVSGLLSESENITLELLQEKGIAKKDIKFLKLIGSDFEFKSKINIKVNFITDSAKNDIIKCGGVVEIV